MRRRIRTAHLIPIPFFDRRPRCLVGIAKLSVLFFGERPSPRLLFALSSFLKIPTSFSANGQNHERAPHPQTTCASFLRPLGPHMSSGIF